MTAESHVAHAARFEPKFDQNGLLTAVACDAATEKVLMVAYMNAEALARTFETGFVHYWSRSRNKLWKKGETSGNLQKVVDILVDCDQDTLCIRVEVLGGGVSCHTGRKSCFYRQIVHDGKNVNLSAVNESG